MKDIIEKQKTTIDCLKSKSPSKAAETDNNAASEAIKKLNESNKAKTIEGTDLKKKNKKLADELSELQNKLMGNDGKGDDSDKCVKLTKAVSNKSKEVSELKAENKTLKEKNVELIKQLNDASSKVTASDIKNTRLETQIENLIEALGKGSSKPEVPLESNEGSRREYQEEPVKKNIKCKHNDKAICLRKESCQYTHNKLVCSKYSKFSNSENEETCPRRHPSGICNRWKRGLCDKDIECFYRHPDGEEGSESRKRALSGQQSFLNNKSQKLTEENQNKQEDNFVFQKMMEMAQKYQNSEGKRLEKKEENIPAGWMNTRW